MWMILNSRKKISNMLSRLYDSWVDNSLFATHNSFKILNFLYMNPFTNDLFVSKKQNLDPLQGISLKFWSTLAWNICGFKLWSKLWRLNRYRSLMEAQEIGANVLRTFLRSVKLCFSYGKQILSKVTSLLKTEFKT